MKFLRLRYMIPVSVAVIFGIILVAYATITFDDDPGVWHGPNNPPYTDPIASYTTDNNFDDYECPPPKDPPPEDCTDPSCTGGPGDGGPVDPPPPPPPPPPPSDGPSTDSF